MKYTTYIVSLSVSALAFTGTITFAAADELQYAGIDAFDRDQLSFTYRSPGGESHFECGIASGECLEQEKSTTTVPMAPNGQGFFALSSDHRFGVVRTVIDPNALVFYSLYRIENGIPSFDRLIPFYGPASSIVFSPDGTAVIFFGTKTVARYSLTTGVLSSMNIGSREFSHRATSKDGTLLSSYDHVAGAHRIWNITRNTTHVIESDRPGPIEFSTDNTQLYFADEADGFVRLYTLAASELDSNTAPRPISDPNTTLVDFLILGNTIYFISNTESDPYNWVLYAYDPETDTRSIIAEHVSYGEYLEENGDVLAYTKITGKHANVVLYDPSNDTHTTLAPFSENTALLNVKKETRTFGEAHGVLWTPENTSSNEPIFVWLHGGPKRQTSFGYHPYLSYGVYDELLERLVDAGAVVLRLDYAGSHGFGDSYMDKLNESIGKSDVQDVVNAVAALKKEFPGRPVHLIGNSYGGYLALRALAEDPAQFAGAVSINGVTDWQNLITRIPSSPFRSYFNGGLSSVNSLLYLQASINTRLANVTDQKMLVVYGEEDDQVPTWQSTSFTHLAKAMGKDTTLLSFEDEGHIIRERKNLNTLCEAVTEHANMTGVACE